LQDDNRRKKEDILREGWHEEKRGDQDRGGGNQKHKIKKEEGGKNQSNKGKQNERSEKIVPLDQAVAFENFRGERSTGQGSGGENRGRT